MIRRLPILASLLAAAFLVTGCAENKKADACFDHPLQTLKTGNQRFTSGHAQHAHLDRSRRHEAAEEGQHPFATVVACSDSRVPVELIFDQGVGDVFVIRVAGNICYSDETGSIEYGVGHLHTPIVVVMGHTQCGAVTAAVQHAEEHGSIPDLLAHIEPAVSTAQHRYPGLNGGALVNAAVECNVWHSVEDLLHHSEITREAVKNGETQVVGAIYDIDTGHVNWLGEHPEQDKIIATSHEHDWSGTSSIHIHEKDHQSVH